jgi:hypothetical protein
MKPFITIKRIERGKWNTTFYIGNQGFTLAYQASKENALWMKKMLSKAFKKLIN